MFLVSSSWVVEGLPLTVGDTGPCWRGRPFLGSVCGVSQFRARGFLPGPIPPGSERVVRTSGCCRLCLVGEAT